MAGAGLGLGEKITVEPLAIDAGWSAAASDAEHKPAEVDAKRGWGATAVVATLVLVQAGWFAVLAYTAVWLI